jgi:hypothetical protein
MSLPQDLRRKQKSHQALIKQTYLDFVTTDYFPRIATSSSPTTRTEPQAAKLLDFAWAKNRRDHTAAIPKKRSTCVYTSLRSKNSDRPLSLSYRQRPLPLRMRCSLR